MAWIAPQPENFLRKAWDTGQCVRLCQIAAPGLPHTSQWRQGRRVRGGNVPRGTVIATFGPSGRYENKTDGSSHAAILLAENSDGLLVIDQWQGQPGHQRRIGFRGGAGTAVNDGDRFHVVEGPAEPVAA